MVSDGFAYNAKDACDSEKWRNLFASVECPKGIPCHMSDNTALLDTWFSSHRFASRDNVGETGISVDEADGSLSYPGHSGREKDIRNV